MATRIIITLLAIGMLSIDVMQQHEINFLEDKLTQAFTQQSELADSVSKNSDAIAQVARAVGEHSQDMHDIVGILNIHTENIKLLAGVR